MEIYLYGRSERVKPSGWRWNELEKAKFDQSIVPLTKKYSSELIPLPLETSRTHPVKTRKKMRSAVLIETPEKNENEAEWGKALQIEYEGIVDDLVLCMWCDVS